jgi:hypothetical protein
VPLLNNVRYASDSDHSRYESELTLWATCRQSAVQKRIHSDHHAGPEVKSRSLVDLEPKIRMTLVRDKKLTVDLAKYDVERA